jgi:hypothetical protein
VARIRGRGLRPSSLFLPLTAAHCRPCTRLEAERAELLHAEDHLRLAGLGNDLAAGDRIQVAARPGTWDTASWPPGHHRPAVTAHDPHQPPTLIIIDLTHPHTFGHRPSLKDQHPPGQCQTTGQT